MRVYHFTQDPHRALAAGFVDATGSWGTRHEYTGVWVLSWIDRQAPEAEHGGVIAVDLPEKTIAEYEWVEEAAPPGHREWLVPADVLNRYPRHWISDAGEADS